MIKHVTGYLKKNSLFVVLAIALMGCAPVFRLPEVLVTRVTSGGGTVTTRTQFVRAEYPAIARLNPQLIRLVDGRILIVGAFSGTTESSEVYTPSTGRWGSYQSASGGAYSLSSSDAITRSDGSLYFTSSAKSYNSSTDSWSAVAGYGGVPVLLNDQSILLSGDSMGAGALASAQRVNPVIAVPSMTYARTGHTAVKLQNGKVLVAGGMNVSASPINKVEIYDPTLNTWSVVQNMPISRGYHASVLLSDGRVLVAGGTTFSGVTRQVHIYNPANDTWSSTGMLNSPRQYFSLKLLSDGRVLAFGYSSGGATSKIEIYDPNTGVWTEHGTALSLGQRAVAVGADDTIYALENNSLKLKIFDFATEQWVSLSDLETTRDNDGAFTLSDGDVLLPPSEATKNARRYNVASDSFSDAGAPSVNRYSNYVQLNTGEVLSIGGRNAAGITYYSLCDRYDPDTNTWVPVASMSVPRYGASITRLGDGRVLVVGGFTTGGVYTASAEIYNPVTDAWVSTTSAPGASSGLITTLANGQVLWVVPTAGHASDVYRYNPNTEVWSAAPGLSEEYDPNASAIVALDDGRVMLMADRTLSGRANLYDPGLDSWTQIVAPNSAIFVGVAKLNDGRVILSGGSLSSGVRSSGVNIFNPNTNTFTAAAGDLVDARAGHAISVLNDGRLFIFGGTLNAGIQTWFWELFSI